MNKERFEELLARMLEGSLSPEEQRELCAMIEAHEEAKEEAWEAWRLDEAIRYVKADPGDVTKCIENVSAVIREEPKQVSQTQERVMERIKISGPVVTRGHRRVAFRWALGVAAAAAIAIAIGWMVDDGWWMGRKVARVASATLGVRCRVSSVGGERTLEVGDEVREGDRISTGENGKVVLAYHVGARVELGEESALSFAMPQASLPGRKYPISNKEPREAGQVSNLSRHGVISKLEKGTFTAEVAKQPEGKPFIVETPHARITVLGTRFTLSATGGSPPEGFRHVSRDTHSTWLQVEEGRVECMRLLDEAKVAVAAGQYVEAGQDVPLVARVIPVHKKPPRFAGWEPAPDGRVLFQDDFDAGLGHWDILLEDNEGWRLLSPGETTSVLTSKQGRRAQGKDHCVFLDPGAFHGKRLALRLKEPPPAAAFSMTCDVIAGKGTTPGGSFGDVVETMMQRNFVDRSGRLPATWHTMRWEVVCTAQDADVDILEMRSFVGKELWRRMRCAANDRHLMVIANGEWLKIDNVVIRELAETGEE